MTRTRRIINVHTHLLKEDDVDARVRLWRECGLVKACVHVLTRADDHPLFLSNQGVLRWVKEYPDLILGFALPDLGWNVDTPDSIDRFKEQGFKGLKFIGPSYAYDDERYFPLYERSQALDMPILFHTGYLAQTEQDRERGISTAKMSPVRLDTIGRAFPGLRMMMAHLGSPEFGMGLKLIQAFKNIYGEYSGGGGGKFRETTLRKLFAPLPGANMTDPDENQALRHYEKLCFATDNPDPPRWIELNERLLDELQIPEDLRERFWWQNAAAWLNAD